LLIETQTNVLILFLAARRPIATKELETDGAH